MPSKVLIKLTLRNGFKLDFVLWLCSMLQLAQLDFLFLRNHISNLTGVVNVIINFCWFIVWMLLAFANRLWFISLDSLISFCAIRLVSLNACVSHRRFLWHDSGLFVTGKGLVGLSSLFWQDFLFVGAVSHLVFGVFFFWFVLLFVCTLISFFLAMRLSLFVFAVLVLFFRLFLCVLFLFNWLFYRWFAHNFYVEFTVLFLLLHRHKLEAFVFFLTEFFWKLVAGLGSHVIDFAFFLRVHFLFLIGNRPDHRLVSGQFFGWFCENSIEHIIPWDCWFLVGGLVEFGHFVAEVCVILEVLNIFL